MPNVDRGDAVAVSIVMPCLNEANTVGDCVDQAKEALALIAQHLGLAGEVIVADNGSTDGSQSLAEARGARVVDVKARGYGAALKGGFEAARGKYLVMGDSDCSYDFRESFPMIEALVAGADLCMGSRFKGEIKPGAMPWKNRYIGNPVLSWILRLLFRVPVSDSHCGLRALTADSYRSLQLSSDGMEFASEMVLKSALKKLKIAEVPVTLSPDRRGRAPHLNPWRDGLRHLFYMFMLSPKWLFFFPACAMLLFGATILGLLIASPDEQMVRIGNFGLGDHWAVAAGSAIIIGVQMATLGFASLLVSYREGYRPVSPMAGWFLRRSTLANWLLLGLAFGILGFGWAATIAAGWVQSDFGALNEMRSLIGAFSLIIVGSQLFFSGFVMSSIAGNRLRHGSTLE